MKLDSQIVGNAGLYFTCYRLSLLGWNTMPTARNACGIDVVAYSRDGNRYLGIQVKSLSKRAPVWLQPNAYDIDRFREAWDRLRRGDTTG